MTTPLAMFPLGSVLFPGALLPLHVFEPRYRVLVHDCLRGEAGPEFGVVLIERGFEVGGGDARFEVGTVARIVEAGELPDGRWVLTAVGTTRRVRVAAWLPEDPYPLAEVEDLPVDAPGPEALAAAERAVRRALALASELGEAAAPPTVELAPDPGLAAWQLAAVAPLGPADHQRLLSTDPADERLALLSVLASEAADVLAYRLAH